MVTKPTDDQLRQAIGSIFQKYDKDRNNTLDYLEIKEVINDAFRNMKSGRNVTDEDVKKFVGAVDQNSDGKISPQELFNIFKKIIEAHFK